MHIEIFVVYRQALPLISQRNFVGFFHHHFSLLIVNFYFASIFPQSYVVTHSFAIAKYDEIHPRPTHPMNLRDFTRHTRCTQCIGAQKKHQIAMLLDALHTLLYYITRPLATPCRCLSPAVECDSCANHQHYNETGLNSTPALAADNHPR